MNMLQKNLKKVRSHYDLTQREIAKRLNMSPNTYNGYEAQGKVPNAEFIKNFCEEFDVSANWLLGLNQTNEDLPLSVSDVYFFIKRLKKNNVYCDNFTLSINPYIAPENANAITIVIEDQDLYKFYQTDKLIHRSEGLYFNPDEYKDWYENNINKLSGRELEGNKYNDAYQKMFNDISKNYYIKENVEYLDVGVIGYYDEKLHRFEDDNEQDDD